MILWCCVTSGIRRVSGTQRRFCWSWISTPRRKTVSLSSTFAPSSPSAQRTSVLQPWQPFWPGSGRTASWRASGPRSAWMGPSTGLILSGSLHLSSASRVQLVAGWYHNIWLGDIMTYDWIISRHMIRWYHDIWFGDITTYDWVISRHMVGNSKPLDKN